ncbi:hypothetical protein [Acinetobacter johnsonii]|uniref:hypothetical protein n=1 Tax=Acinetobacter johnsonii TaxID=40214 RepID=UPI00244854CD|nr:hypothetical protein [Acinetobacter johnsonii]MDH1706234.1 hypothetical protein [Acinetobacter johnsonii]
MKPCSRRVLLSSNVLQIINTGPVVAKIKGSVKKLGDAYQDATIVLYSKANLQPIAVTRPDQNGNYCFFSLNTSLNTFIAAFDRKQEFNAVIQDNVVPK